MPIATEELCRHAREKAFYAYGTGQIFERRMRLLKGWRATIVYLGIGVPGLVGFVALSFGKQWVTYLEAVAGIVLAFQFAISLWSVVDNWDERYAYALAAARANMRLFTEWDSVAKLPPDDVEAHVKELDAENNRQDAADLGQAISVKEKRYGMRSALFYFRKVCATCNQMPMSLKPLNCDTCGNF
jgi:mobilome CxxCx(11)CxxC protein